MSGCAWTVRGNTGCGVRNCRPVVNRNIRDRVRLPDQNIPDAMVFFICIKKSRKGSKNKYSRHGIVRPSQIPFFRCLLDCQINNFSYRVIRREHLALLDSCADHAVQRLAGICCVDGLANSRRITEQCMNIFQCARQLLLICRYFSSQISANASRAITTASSVGA